MAEAAWRTNVLNTLERSEKMLQQIAQLLKKPAQAPIFPFFGQTRINAEAAFNLDTSLFWLPKDKRITKLSFGWNPDGTVSQISAYMDAEHLFTLQFSWNPDGTVKEVNRIE
jgi:hypothetical protein